MKSDNRPVAPIADRHWIDGAFSFFSPNRGATLQPRSQRSEGLGSQHPSESIRSPNRGGTIWQRVNLRNRPHVAREDSRGPSGLFTISVVYKPGAAHAAPRAVESAPLCSLLTFFPISLQRRRLRRRF